MYSFLENRHAPRPVAVVAHSIVSHCWISFAATAATTAADTASGAGAPLCCDVQMFYGDGIIGNNSNYSARGAVMALP